jgi:hypothetical protein
MYIVIPDETGLHGPVHLLVTANLTHVLAEGVCAECDQAQPFLLPIVRKYRALRVVNPPLWLNWRGQGSRPIAYSLFQ